MAQFNRTPLAAAVALAFTAAAPVLAQTQAPADKPATGQSAPASLPEVRSTAEPVVDGFRTIEIPSATRTETPLRDIPQFINIVPQNVIESQGATSLQSALRNVPGITYTAPEGGSLAAQVVWLRGFPAGGDIFLDGIRDIGEYNRDLFAIQAVEVLKGPSALIFGRGSPGGVINQVSRFADFVPRAEIGLSLGTFGEKRLTGDLNIQTSDSSALRIVALGEKSDTSIDSIQNDQIGVAPSFRFGIGRDTSVMLGAYYLKTESKTSYGQPNLGATFGYQTPPVSLETYYGLSNYDYTDWETYMATVIIDHRFNESLSLRNATRWANYQRQMEATIPALQNKTASGQPVTAATPLDQLRVNLTHTKARDNDDDVIINQTDLVWRPVTGGIRHTVLTSLELSWEDLHRQNYTFTGTTVVNTSYLSPDIWAPLNYTKTIGTSSPVETSNVGIVLQDQIQFSPEWQALVGIRWDRYDAEAKTLNPNGTIATNGGPFSRTDDMWSGRLGAIWQPAAWQSYYVAWGNSYNPSGEIGVYGGTSTNLNAANQLLDPEENATYELGGQWDLNDQVQIRAALFRNAKEKARMTDPLLGTITLDGERRVDGLELSVAGRLAPNWDLYANAAYMTGEIVKSGNPLTEGKVPLGVPRLSGNVWTVYRFLQNWEVGGGFFASSYFWMDDQNRAKNPGYARWDATIAYLQPAYDIRLNVFNIGDTKYYLGGYQNNPTRVLPGIPLSAMVTFNYRFL